MTGPFLPDLDALTPYMHLAVNELPAYLIELWIDCVFELFSTFLDLIAVSMLIMFVYELYHVYVWTL